VEKDDLGKKKNYLLELCPAGIVLLFGRAWQKNKKKTKKPTPPSGRLGGEDCQF